MLKVQEYLRSGKTLDDLKAEYGIVSTAHPSLPLAILNYHQIESPKTHPVVRECRGLTLQTTDWSLVARSFPRFFNWGEMADEMPHFDFNDCTAQTKEDGSLCVLYRYGGVWHGNTRGSFGLDAMQFCSFSWRDAFLKAMGVDSWAALDGILDPALTYVCEFCSPWNKVVRSYPQPALFLLTAFRGHEELHWEEVDALDALPFARPFRYRFRNIDQVKNFLDEKSESDKTFEGVVLRDHGNRRWKVKSPTYLSLHRLRGDGDNLYHPKNLLPFVLAGEGDELLTYFPEVADAFQEVKRAVDSAYADMESVWRRHKDIPVQKDFAMAIAGATPFTGILFGVRKRWGAEQTPERLRQFWRESDGTILKLLFKV